MFFFQPLYVTHKLTNDEMEEDMGDLLEDLDEDAKHQLESENEKEVNEDKVWYDVRRYRVRTKFVLVWPVMLIFNVGLLVLYLIVQDSNKGTQGYNVFSAPCFWLVFYGDIMMAV